MPSEEEIEAAAIAMGRFYCRNRIGVSSIEEGFAEDHVDDFMIEAKAALEAAEAVRELKDLKNQMPLYRAHGLSLSLMDTAHWEDVNKDGLHKVAKEISDIIGEFLKEKE